LVKKRRKERPGAFFLLGMTGIAGLAAVASTVVALNSGIDLSIN
jgi:hypothetical protein